MTEDFASLVAEAGAMAGSEWTLDREEFTIGRSAECDLVVSDRQVSREHARLRRVEGLYVVDDLGSKNGTHVNGRRVVGSARLHHGDEIQVALALRLRFVAKETAEVSAETGISETATGRLRLDQPAHRVWVGGTEVDPPLSAAQYRFLEILYAHSGQVVARDRIVAYVWREAAGVGVSEQAIDALARRLRGRLAEADPGRRYIVTVRGHGFRLDNAA